MNGKQIGAIITAVFMIPTLVGLFVWTLKITSDPSNPKHIEEGANMVRIGRAIFEG